MRFFGAGGKMGFGRARKLWTPTDLVDGQCWLDASDSSTITLSGSNISLWEDKIGSNDADDAVNSSNVKITTARPTISIADQNGLDAIAFNGSQWFDHLSAKGLLRNRSDALMAMVVKFGTRATQSVWSNRNTNTFQRRFAFVGLASSNLLIGNRLDNETATSVQSQLPNDTNWNLVVARLSYYDDMIYHRVNGLSAANNNLPSGGANTSDTDISGTAANTFIAIGAGNRNGSAARLTNGSRIGELICGAKTSGSYSFDELEQLEGYLAHKWGLASLLPSTHAYKNAAP